MSSRSIPAGTGGVRHHRFLLRGKAVNEAQNNGVNATHHYAKREIYVKIRQRINKQSVWELIA